MEGILNHYITHGSIVIYPYGIIKELKTNILM